MYKDHAHQNYDVLVEMVLLEFKKGNKQLKVTNNKKKTVYQRATGIQQIKSAHGEVMKN